MQFLYPNNNKVTFVNFQRAAPHGLASLLGGLTAFEIELMALKQSFRSLSSNWRHRWRKPSKDLESCGDSSTNSDLPKSASLSENKPRSKRLSMFSKKANASNPKVAIKVQVNSTSSSPATVRTAVFESNNDTVNLPEPPLLKLGQSLSVSSNLTLCNDLDTVLGFWGLPKDTQETVAQAQNETLLSHDSTIQLREQQNTSKARSLKTAVKLLVLVNTALILRSRNYHSRRNAALGRIKSMERKQSLADLVQQAKGPLTAFDTNLLLSV